MVCLLPDTFSAISPAGSVRLCMPASVTLRCEDALFTGDTLFRGSCGRTDLPGGDFDRLMASLARLADIPGDLEVYPGHMGPSSLAVERVYNRYVRYAKGQ